MIEISGYKMNDEFYRDVIKIIPIDEFCEFLKNDDVCFKKVEMEGYEVIILKEDNELNLMKRIR